jgi:hypothetical protein
MLGSFTQLLSYSDRNVQVKDLLIILIIVEVVHRKHLICDTFVGKETCPLQKLLGHSECIHHLLFIVHDLFDPVNFI